jgi:hypothetical protein
MEATLRPPAAEPEDAGRASEAGGEPAVGINLAGETEENDDDGEDPR